MRQVKKEVAEAVGCALRHLIPGMELTHTALGCPFSTDIPSVHDFRLDGAKGDEVHALVIILDKRDYMGENPSNELHEELVKYQMAIYKERNKKNEISESRCHNGENCGSV